jgi:hypothetical protein
VAGARLSVQLGSGESNERKRQQEHLLHGAFRPLPMNKAAKEEVVFNKNSELATASR